MSLKTKLPESYKLSRSLDTIINLNSWDCNYFDEMEALRLLKPTSIIFSTVGCPELA